MTKTYYRSEYTEKQWKALIDKATELDCQITYNRYGDRAEIDSTNRENQIIARTGRGEQDRAWWGGEHSRIPAGDRKMHYRLYDNMSSKRIYNRVMDDCSGVCPLGELLTDKELERMRLYNSKRDWPNTTKVAVKTREIYFSFGVRFAEDYELI